MARDVSVGWSEFSRGNESHSTLQLTLRGVDQPEVKLRMATAELVIDGAVYEPHLSEVVAMKLSLDRGDDYVEVRLQNPGQLSGSGLTPLPDALRGARARFGRYWRDSSTGQAEHQTLLTGVVTSVQADQDAVTLMLVSEAHYSWLIPPTGSQKAQSLVQASTVEFDPTTFHVSIQSPSEGARISPKGMLTGMLHVVYDFNAPTNGTDDATFQIQAAINSAAISPFKTVYLPPGKFRVSRLVLKNDVTIAGAGSLRTILESVSDEPVITVETEAYRSSIRGLQIKGDVTKGNQVGILLAGTSYYYNCFIEDVVIEDCGSHGLVIKEAYASAFEKIKVSNCAGYPFLIDATNRPNLVLRDCYASMLRASAPVGFRIKAGQQVRLENCNGIDNALPGSKWAVFGRKDGVDGDKSNESTYVQLVSCNVESWVSVGVDCLSNSVVSFESCHFAGGVVGNSPRVPIRYQVDSSSFPAFFAKGTIDDKTIFADGPASNYANGAAIHSNDLPPLMLSGQGSSIASDQPLSQYFDTTTGRKEFLTRADGFHKRATVTTSTSFSRPGVRLIEVTHAAPVTITLPWPGWYRVGEPVIILDAAGVAATYPITINANAAGTINKAGSYVLNKNRQAVILLPNDSVTDWRVVADFSPGASSAPKFVSSVGRGNRTLDWTTALTRQHTLTGNTTFTFTNGIAGQIYTLILMQDAVGGWGVNWPSSVTWPGGGVGQPTPNADSKDVFQFVYTGSQWLNVSQSYDLS